MLDKAAPLTETKDLSSNRPKRERAVPTKEPERRAAYERLVAELDPSGEPHLVFTRRARNNPESEPRRLGVLAASFNPPTNAHLELAIQAREQFALDEVVLELTKANVDKAILDAPLHERFVMLDRLCASYDWLSVAAGTHGRFLEKMIALRAHFPHTEIFFIVGFDTLVRVLDGKYYADRNAELRRLFDACAFLCANRGDAGDEVIHALLTLPENAAFANRISPLRLDEYHASLSSTQVRALLKSGETDISSIPDSVLAYVFERGLYWT